MAKQGFPAIRKLDKIGRVLPEYSIPYCKNIKVIERQIKISESNAAPGKAAIRHYTLNVKAEVGAVC